jgi:hypothetical protein
LLQVLNLTQHQEHTVGQHRPVLLPFQWLLLVVAQAEHTVVAQVAEEATVVAVVV